jgi:hypothetical protein
MKKLMLILLTSIIIINTSCDSEMDTNCTLESVAGLKVVVKDAITNELLPIDTSVIAQDGDYIETLVGLDVIDEISFLGAWERAGLYQVTVSKEGYQTYTTEPTIVSRDDCHVITQNITIYLVPND